MTTRIKIRRDIAANWLSANPILAAGEPGLETDTGKTKYGDGTTTWTSLDYANGVVRSREQVGYFTAIAPEIPNFNYDVWFESVVADPDGNAYYVGGTYIGPDWIRVIKVDTEGERVWEKEIDWADGYEGHGISAVYNTTTDQLVVVAEVYKNLLGLGQEECFSVITMNPTTGAIVGDPIVVRDDIISDGSEYGWMSPTDIILTASGDPVVCGTKGGNAVLFPVTTQTGSTVDTIFVDAAQFYDRYPSNYHNWYITGTNITNHLNITEVNYYYNQPATPLAGTGTGATFTISSDGAGGYVVDGTTNGGSGYAVGNKIKVLGTDLGGATPGNDAVITVVSVSGGVIDGVGTTPSGTSTGTAQFTTSGTSIASGSNATFTAEWRMKGSEVYFPSHDPQYPYYGVTQVQAGSGFAVGDTLALPAASYGGLTTGTVTVTTVGGSGEITGYSFTGTFNTNTIKLQTNSSFDFGVAGSWTIQNFNSESFVWSQDWCVNFGGSSYDDAHAMDQDSSGNIYVAAQTYDLSVNAGTDRALLVKISSTGTLVWSKNFDPVGWSPNPSGYTGVVVDSNNDIIVVGDETITKVDSSGTVLWQKSIMIGIPYPFDMWNACVDVDNNDNIYVAAEYDHASTTESDNFIIVKFDTNGNVLWQREAGTSTEENANWMNGYQIITVQGNKFYIAGSSVQGDQDVGLGISLPTDGTGARNERRGRYLYRETSWDISTSTATVDVMEIGFQTAEVITTTTNTFAVSTVTNNVVETMVARIGDVDGRINNLYSIEFEDGTVQKTAYVGGIQPSGSSPRIYNTNNYVLDLADAGKMIRWDSSGWSNSLQIYVPNNTDVAFPVGTQIHFMKDRGINAFMFWNGVDGNDSNVTILPATPATGLIGNAYNSGEGWSVHHIDRGIDGSNSPALVTLTQVATNRWLLSCSSANHIMDWDWLFGL